MTDATKLPPLPEPFDYCFEWDGPYGTRKFSAASRNGMTPTRSVPLFNADQMHAYAETARAQLLAEIEALRKRATCGCGDMFTEHDPGTCGACVAATDRTLEIDAMRKRAEDAELDAARYRWLRDGCNDKHSATSRIAAKCYGMEWDAAIDAAIKGSAA